MSLSKDIVYSIVPRLWRPRNAATVLTYHSVSDAPIYSAIHPDMFRKQMKLLHDEKFNVVSLAKLAEYRAQGSIPPKTVSITFDDGYLDNFTNAFPILKQYNFPATIFVITSAIGGSWSSRGSSFAMMREKELHELTSDGLIALEPHTVTHPKLTKIPAEETEAEVRASREVLEKLLGRTCVHFAYPFGKHTDDARKAVERAGIQYAYTTEEGLIRPTTNTYLLHRNGVNRTMSLTQFRGAVLCGRLSRTRLILYLKHFI